MLEEWRSILGGAYEISSEGRLRRAIPGRKTFVGKILKPHLVGSGYLAFAATINGANKPFYLHALVAEAFIGPRPEGYDINHKDGNKKNNVWTNIEYMTHSDNMYHAYEHGLMSKPGPKPTIKPLRILKGLATGERHWTALYPEKLLEAMIVAKIKLAQKMLLRLESFIALE